MSVLIKGLKMPKDCPQCPLSHWNKLDQLTGCELVRRYVPESESSYWQSDTRPEWCPLVELPGHGDLIDRDALKEPMESVSVNDIEALPTIDAVSRGVHEQVMWERDLAISQLNEIGKSWGEKMDNVATVVRCKDCRWKEKEQPGMVYCPAVVGGWVDEDWFCKGGERSEE